MPRQPMSEAQARRYFRRWIVATAAAALIVWAVALVTYVQARPLLAGVTLPVSGEVVEEEKGFLGIRNLLTVEYEFRGRSYREIIPVKGNGFGGLRISPYFYKRGTPVELLVVYDNPSSARTRDRWMPATYNWTAVGGVLLFFLLLLTSMRSFIIGRRRQDAGIGQC